MRKRGLTLHLDSRYQEARGYPRRQYAQVFPPISSEAFYENLKLVAEVEKVAAKKGATPPQIAIAWIRAHSGEDGFPIIIPIPGATTEARVEKYERYEGD